MFFKKELTKPQLWAMATLLIYTESREGSVNFLGGFPFKKNEMKFWVDDLAKWWHINGKNELLEQLDWLESTGDRPKSDKNIAAWDFCRHISLCGEGYLAGYFTAEEAWQYIMPVAKKMQSEFSSWEEMADSYLEGYWQWSESSEGLKEREAIKNDLLKNYSPGLYTLLSKHKNSAWVELAWDMPLE